MLTVQSAAPSPPLTVHVNIKILLSEKEKECRSSLAFSASRFVMRRAQENECLTIWFSSYINHRAGRDAPRQIS